jgi:hypothetical protein
MLRVLASSILIRLQGTVSVWKYDKFSLTLVLSANRPRLSLIHCLDIHIQRLIVSIGGGWDNGVLQFSRTEREKAKRYATNYATI